MLQNDATGRFAKQFTGAPGPVSGFTGMQSQYGLQSTVPANRGMAGLPTSAAPQQPLRGFGGANAGLQQQSIGQFGQQPGRPFPTQPGLAMNGLPSAAQARANVGGPLAMNAQLAGIGRAPGTGAPVGASAANVLAGGISRGGQAPGLNLGTPLQQGPRLPAMGAMGPGSMPFPRNAQQGQGPRPVGLGLNGPGEFTIQTEDFPPISGTQRVGGQADLRMQSQQLRGQQAPGGYLMPQQSQQLPRGALNDLHAAQLQGGDPRAPTPPTYQSDMHIQLQKQQVQQQQQATLLQQQQAQALKVPGQSAAVGAAAPPRGPAFPGVSGLPHQPDRSLMGLLNVIRMKDPDLTTLALGTDLTTLGLNLNSPENLYRTFVSPWADSPQAMQPEYKIPLCYIQSPPRLQPGCFARFQLDTLFYVFYSMPGDEAQLYAADELSHRGWWYHKDFKVWLTRVPNAEPLFKSDAMERGSYMIFNTNTWEVERKDNVTLFYEQLERPPAIRRPPPPVQPAASQQLLKQ